MHQRSIVVTTPARVRHAWTLARRALTVALALGLLLLSPGAQRFVIAGAQPDPFQEAVDKLDSWISILEETRASLDATRFDVEELSFDLAFEAPEGIATWVRDEVAFEPYVGLLRGPDGTLLSRAGNALDQSVLLARLLRDAGYDVRVARGALTPDDARTLVLQLADPRPAEPAFSDLDRIQELFVALNDLGGISAQDSQALFDDMLGSEDVTDADLYLAAGQDADELLARLSAEGWSLGDVAMTDTLVGESLDYFWVEYRLSDSDPWTASHPAFADPAAAPQGIASTEIYTESIPQALQHRIRFQAFVEQRLGPNLVVHPLMAPWERPVANLVGMPLTYRNAADTLVSVEDFADPEQGLEDAILFAPNFAGALPPGGQTFDLAGNAVDPEAANNPAAGIFQTVGGAFGSAAGALSGGGDDFVALSAHWLEYTLIAPDGTETVHRRSVVDLIDPQVRADGGVELLEIERAALASALTREHVFMVGAHRTPQAFTLDRVLEKMISMRPLFELYLFANYHPGEEIRYDPGELDEVDTDWSGHLLLYANFDRGADALGVDRSYRHEPALVVYEADLAAVDGASEGIDVVSNGRRMLTASGGEIALDTRAMVRAGTWETHNESLVLSVDPDTVVSTMRVFAAAEAEGIETLVLAPDDVATVDALPLDAFARRHIASDLERGFVVVVPAEQPEALPMTGWWRVDPRSGETLGMLANGRGSQIGERLVVGMIATFTITAVACYVLKDGDASNNDSTAKKMSDCGKLAVAFTAIIPAGAFYFGVAIAATKAGGLALAILFAILELMGNF